MKSIMRKAFFFLLITLILSEAGWAAQRSTTPRWHVGKVIFNGNKTFGRAALLDKMICQPFRLFDRTPFSASAVDDDIAVLRSLYRNQGFLQSTVTLDKMNADSSRHRMNLFIRIMEGKRTFIEKTEFVGSTLISEHKLLSVIRSTPDNPLIATRIDEDSRRILALFTEKGYLQAQVASSVALNPATEKATVQFSISQRSIVQTGQVHISGLSKVRERLVRRELRFHPGDTLTSTGIQESSRMLYETNLFKRVDIAPQPLDSVSCDTVAPCIRDVSVTLSEGKMVDVETGIGYGTYEQLRGSARISYKNLFGLGKKISLFGKASYILQQGELAYTDPHLLGSLLVFDAGGYYGHHNEVSYEANIGGLRSGLGLTTRQHITYRLSVRWEDIRFLRPSPVVIDTLEAKKTASLAGTITFDLRDDVFNPVKGFYLSFQTEIAGFIGLFSNRFVRSTLDMRSYFPVLKYLNISSGFQAGAMHEYWPSPIVPIQERFFTGGGTSIRGFGEKLVGPDTLDAAGNPIPVGGRYMLVLHIAECRFPIYKILYGAVFFDAGNVWSASSDFFKYGLRFSAGTGIRLNIPLGVIRLDGALRLNPNPYYSNEPIGAIHFDIGQAF